MPQSDLAQLYDAVEQVTADLAEGQPWWPCLSCPVAKSPANCCNKAMFHVTHTEWEHLREHPFIRQNWTRLIKNSRRRIRSLRESGVDTTNWSDTIARFGQSGADFTCPLLDVQTGRCNVYDRRPLICRTYGMGFPTTDGAVFGCSIVTAAVAQHEGEHVNFIPLDQINAHASTFMKLPSKPIIAWLSGEDIHAPSNS